MAGLAAVLAAPWSGLQGDDDDPVRPFDPGGGFEGILPNPPADPNLIVDQTTSPYGVRQVFNTPETIMGQSFRPLHATIDWVAFVFQNNTQPNTTPGPGSLRASLYSSLNGATGVLDGLLGTSEPASIDSDSTAWLLFRFPETITVIAGETYYCRLEMLEGYPCWAGGRLQNFYSGGRAFGYLPDPYGRPPQNLRWDGYDLVFAVGSRRRPIDLPDGDYAEWCATHGLADPDPSQDPDSDGQSNLTEYLRDGDPGSGSDLGKGIGHFVDVDGQRFWAATVATPAGLDYAAYPDGTVGAVVNGALSDRFLASVKLSDFADTDIGLVESIPAFTNGLPPLPSSHVYRTFRLNKAVSAAPQGFIVNRVEFGGD